MRDYRIKISGTSDTSNDVYTWVDNETTNVFATDVTISNTTTATEYNENDDPYGKWVENVRLASLEEMNSLKAKNQAILKQVRDNYETLKKFLTQEAEDMKKEEVIEFLWELLENTHLDK